MFRRTWQVSSALLFLLVTCVLLPSPVLAETKRDPTITGVARDPALEAWQREFTAGTARGMAADPTGLSSAPRASSATEANGAWSEGPLPTSRAYHTAIYDPVGQRMLLFGGFDSSPRNDTWALSLFGGSPWRKLRPTGGAPSGRYSHVAIHDPVRNRMLIFGGFDGSRRNDVWALSLTRSLTWTQIFPSGGAPSPRQWSTAIYDPVRDRMLVFGGLDGGYSSDVWALSLSGTPGWTEITPSGPLPSGRYLHGATYDPVGDRMLIFGGVDENGSRSDTWALSLSGDPVWSEVAEAGPPGRSAGTTIFDPVRDRLLVFGGYGGSGNDVWALSLSGSPVWSQLTPGGGAPPARTNHSAIYDPKHDRMVIVDGLGFEAAYLNDFWALSLSGSPTWSEVTPAGPRIFQSRPLAIYDPVRDRMVLFRGVDGPLEPSGAWALSLSGHPAWSRISASGNGPSSGAGNAVYDPVRDRMIVLYGGVDVWALSFSGTPAWSHLSPAGIPPQPRNDASAIYDPVADRVVIFGGAGVFGMFNDAWGLSLSGTPTWTALAPITMAPVARAGHVAIYDPKRSRMVVFGGFSQTGYRADTWALTLADPPVWSQIVGTGDLPVGRERSAAFYDPVRDRMVVFGGSGITGWRNDAVTLSLADEPIWSLLTPAGDPPTGRSSHAAIYDPSHDRMVAFGGRGLAIFRTDTWSLGWGPPPTLSLSPSPSLLWPPNHKLVEVHVNVVAGGDDPEVALASVTSDEPDAGTSSDDVPQDIQGDAIGAAVNDLQLRSERADTGDGRTYTLCYEALNSGGITTRCEAVTVPLSRRGKAGLTVSAGRWTLTCYGDPSMSARSIEASSVGMATEDFARTLATEGMPAYADMDGDGTEDAVFVLAADPTPESIAAGDVRYAYWEADGTFYLASIQGSVTGIPDARSPVQFTAAVSSNPARGQASIRYAIPRAGRVRVGIYDTMGREVTRLVDGWRPAGWHTVPFEGGPSSQMYLYRIDWEGKSVGGKVAILR